jgi:protein-tyrosine phosphatase
MQRRGLDLSGHRSQLLSVELVNQADHIFVMTQGHWDSVVRTVPSAKDRCRLLCDGEVDDPMGGSTERYAECAAQLEAGLRERLKEVEI